MELSGTAVYSVVRSGPLEQQYAVLQDLKTHVKKDNVQLPWVAKYFEALSIATDSNDAHLQTLAFSLVCHLVKRVSIQDPRGLVLLDQSFLVLPLLIPRIADHKTSVKVAAKRALEAYWLSAPRAVEHAMVELGLANRNLLLVNECVAWLNYILTTVSPHFRLDAFLDPLARILREHAADEKLTANIKVLLENYYDLKQNRIRKFDLQKALERNNVPSTLRISIMGTDSIISRTAEPLHHSRSLPQVLAPKGTSLKSTHASPPPYTGKPFSTPSLRIKESCPETKFKAPKTLNGYSENPGLSENLELRAFLSKVPNYEFDATIKPLNLSDANELDQIFTEMSPFFEGKETERNWGAREKSIIKLRSLIRGNAITDFLGEFIVNIMDTHEGICKSLLSLRTTLSVNSCQLVKEMVFLLRTNFEQLIDLFVPTLLKLCSNTKNLTNTNANMAMCAVLAQCPLNTKLCQKLLIAASEKSVNTKAFACSWLQIFIIRSHDLWKSSGSELAEKVLLKLLPDPNMQVRQAAKDAYWKYCEYAKELAIELRSQLDANINRALERSRPKGLAVPALPPSSAPKSRPSLKESIMAKKRELKIKQNESRPASRNDLIHAATPLNENIPNPSFPRKFERAASFEGHAQPSTAPFPKLETKPVFDRLPELGSENTHKTSNSSPEVSNRKSSRHCESPKTVNAPHYAQSTFSHPSTIVNQKRSISGSNLEHVKNSSFSDIDLKPSQPRVHATMPKIDFEEKPSGSGAEDPMLKFLASSDEELLKEGINMLRHAIMNGEENITNLSSLLKKLSVTNPMALRPLFEVNGVMLQKVFKFFTRETFLRLSCILISPAPDFLNLIISFFTADELYTSLNTMLSYLLELTDIVDDGLLIMQLIKFKDKILTMVLQILTHAVSKVPIMDVTLTRILRHLFELVPVVHQTKLVDDYKVLLRNLHSINSSLFISELSATKGTSKQEIELLVGIDDLLEFKNTESTVFNMTEFTRISPGQNLEHLSPLKFPSDFTMLFPTTKAKTELKTHLEESNVDLVEPSMGSKAAVVEERIPLEEPPHMKIVSEEDIVMEDIDENHTKNIFEDEAMDESKIQGSFMDNSLQSNGATDIKLEAADFNILQKPDLSGILRSSNLKDEPHELVEDFASVRLNSQSNSIETFIEKMDPLNKLSSRNRPISIYDDSKACSPQKVKDYDFTELNWFNFLMAKMSLDYGLEDLERYSKQDFRSLCEQLSSGTANETSVATMMKYLRVPDPESLTSFLRNEGYSLVEDAVMDYLKHDHSDLLGGLMVIKQLLVSRHAVDISRLWGMLLDLSGLDSEEPLRTLDLAIGETFDEVLCGMYSSKDLLQVVTHTLQISEGDVVEGRVKFALECLLKLVSMESLVLSIDEELVMRIDGAIRRYVAHKRADIRKLVIESYGRTCRAARISEGNGEVAPRGRSSHEAVAEVMMGLSRPQQRIIEYFSQGN